MSEKQIVRVLSAVKAGCETSDQVSAFTGMSIETCSAYLSSLRADGLVRITRRARRKIGRPFNSYVVAGAS